MSQDYDVTLIAGHREALLTRTLASFSERVFRHFPIRDVIVNIDPFMGDAAEGDRCEALVLTHFPDARIFRPEEPDFASAVARVWSATTAPRVLHLEDDWIALEDITPGRIEPLFEGDVRAVTFMSEGKHTRGLLHHATPRTFQDSRGMKFTVMANAFSTSPGVFDGDFMRHSASLLRPGLDPEKQFYRQINHKLEDYAFGYRCMFLRGTNLRELIEDIGREAREDQGIVKTYERGRSVWRRVDGGPDGAAEV